MVVSFFVALIMLQTTNPLAKGSNLILRLAGSCGYSLRKKIDESKRKTRSVYESPLYAYTRMFLQGWINYQCSKAVIEVGCVGRSSEQLDK